MTYRIEDGRYEGICSDGRIIIFEDASEMLDCAKVRQELFELVGRPLKNIDEIKKMIILSTKKVNIQEKI